MIIKGFRQSGQGDIRARVRVPFLAIKAGLKILDIRVNDRVSHAFPPYCNSAAQASLEELQNWEAVFKDPAYLTRVSGALAAGGGSESDIAGFFGILDNVQQAFAGAAKNDYAFLWLINPVLLVTFARKSEGQYR